MGFLSVHLYRANGNDQKWLDRAEAALSDMESQVNFSIYTYDEGSVSVNIGNDQTDMLDNWESYIENNNISVNQYDVHLLLINDPSTDVGAGALRGEAVGPRGGTAIAGSEGTAGFANAAVRFNSACYGNDPVYRPTVIHEVSHAALHKNMNLPAYREEHSVGSVYNDGNDTASPMQLWYTNEFCSGNDPLSNNCNGREDEASEGATTDLTICATNKMNNYMSSF